MSIPRLQLMGAPINVRLTKLICNAMESSMHEVTFWIDRTTTAFWFCGQSRTYKPFVAHRIREIQQVLSPALSRAQEICSYRVEPCSWPWHARLNGIRVKWQRLLVEWTEIPEKTKRTLANKEVREAAVESFQRDKTRASRGINKFCYLSRERKRKRNEMATTSRSIFKVVLKPFNEQFRIRFIVSVSESLGGEIRW